MIVHLPDPVVARVIGFGNGQVIFHLRDAAHVDAFEALFQKATDGGYSVEVRLVHYEGQPSMVEQAKARKARKGVENDCTQASLSGMDQ